METQALAHGGGVLLAPGLNGVARVGRLGQAPLRNDLAAYVTTRGGVRGTSCSAHESSVDVKGCSQGASKTARVDAADESSSAENENAARWAGRGIRNQDSTKWRARPEAQDEDLEARTRRRPRSGQSPLTAPSCMTRRLHGGDSFRSRLHARYARYPRPG